MKNLYSYILISILTLICFVAYADKIHLHNGDQISGDIQYMAEGKLVLKSQYAGEITIPFENVKSIESSSSIPVLLENGDRITAQVVSKRGEKLTLKSDLLGTINLSTRDIAAINVMSASEVGKHLQAAEATIKSLTTELSQTKEQLSVLKDATDLGKLWNGNISLLGGLKVGNREAYDFYLKSIIKRITDREELTIRGSIGYGETEGVVDTTEGSLQPNLRIYYAENSYVFGDLLLEHDRFEDLDLRVDGTVGAGYRFWKTENSEFLGDIGAGLTEEIYKGGDNTTEVTMRASFEYIQTLFEKTKLSQLLTIYPSLGNFGDVRLISETSLITPISDSLSWTLNILDEYDTNPNRPGVKSNDLSVRTGLQYSF